MFPRGAPTLTPVDLPSPLAPPSALERTALKVRWLPALKTIDQGPLDRGLLPGYAFAVLIAIAALAARVLADPYLATGFPFLTFFPAVIIAAFFFGLYPGVLCAAICTFIAWAIYLDHAVTVPAIVALIFFISVVGIDLLLIHLMHRAFVMLARTSARSEQLAAERAVYVSELDHRIKNIFATTAALVSMTARRTKTPAEMAEALQGRLAALGRGAALLRAQQTSDDRTYADLFDLVLQPMNANGGIMIDKTALDHPAPASSTASVSLIIHELGTNAVKYGGLSVPTGQVRVSGKRDRAQNALVIHWEETGGPPPHPKPATGFGSYLLENITRAMGGKISLDFQPAGLVASFAVPLTALPQTK